MIAAFFHDDRLVMDSESNVYSTTFSYKIWKRYLNVFDSLIVATRMKVVGSDQGNITDRMMLSCGPSVEFAPVMEYSKKIDLILNKRKIVQQIKATMTRCDCVIIRLPSFIGSIACEVAKASAKPYLIELVGCPWDAYWNHSISGKVVAPFAYFTTRRKVRNASWVLYVTNEFLQNRYPTLGKSIGVSDVLIPDANDHILKKRLDKIARMREGGPTVLGTIAVLDVRYKGQEYVVRAIQQLNLKGGNFEYWLAGGGKQTYLKKIAEKYNVSGVVKFLGYLTHEQVFEYLDDVDIYVQPSKTEGLPRALIEAMSRGCPAIGSRTGGIPELIQDEAIFRRGSTADIIKLLSAFNKADLNGKAKRNYNKAKDFNVSVLEKKRNNFYQLFAENL